MWFHILSSYPSSYKSYIWYVMTGLDIIYLIHVWKSLTFTGTDSLCLTLFPCLEGEREEEGEKVLHLDLHRGKTAQVPTHYSAQALEAKGNISHFSCQNSVSVNGVLSVSGETQSWIWPAPTTYRVTTSTETLSNECYLLLFLTLALGNLNIYC